MKTEEYWIGYGIEYEGLWRAFESGYDYVDKYKSTRVHLLRLEFEQYPIQMPLFNHEAIYKTIKGCFHDVKVASLTQEDYGAAGPIYLYSIERGSGIWNFLGEIPQLIIFGTTLTCEKLMGQKLENFQRRLSIIREYFGDVVTPELFERFMNASTPRKLNKAIQKLCEQGLRSVQISREPFEGDPVQTEQTLIDLKKILEEMDE